MKNFLWRHYYLTGFLTAVIIIVGGCFIGLILGFWLLQSAKPAPSPNDGAAMASGIILSLFMQGSLIAGSLGGLFTAHVLKKRLEDKTENDEWFAKNS